MPGEVLSFGRRKPADELQDPHLAGLARCTLCAHEWQAVTPVGTKATNELGLECPACHAFKGILKRFVQYTGETAWHCTACDCALFQCILLGAETTPTLACCGCGQLTNALDLFNKP